MGRVMSVPIRLAMLVILFYDVHSYMYSATNSPTPVDDNYTDNCIHVLSEMIYKLPHIMLICSPIQDVPDMSG